MGRPYMIRSFLPYAIPAGAALACLLLAAAALAGW